MVKLSNLLALICVFLFAKNTRGQDQDETAIAIQSKHARLTCVHYLDSYLSLSTEQAAKLEAAFENKWGSDYDRNSWYVTHNGYSLASSIIGLLDKKELEEFLSQGQMDRFNLLSSLALNLTDQLNWVNNMEQEDPIRDQLRLAGTLEIERLKTDLKLDEQQEMRLRIACKGAGAKVLATRSKINGNTPQIMLADQETFRVLMEGPSFQLSKTPLWKNAIAKTLTEDQTEVYRASQQVKFDRSIDAATFSFLMSYQREAKPFTSKEYAGMFGLVKKSLLSRAEESGSDQIPSFYFEAFSFNYDIKDEDVATVLSGEKLEHVKGVLEAARQRKADLEKEKDESPDSNRDQE